MPGGMCWPCSLGQCRFCTGCNCNHTLLKHKKPKAPKKPRK